MAFKDDFFFDQPSAARQFTGLVQYINSYTDGIKV